MGDVISFPKEKPKHQKNLMTMSFNNLANLASIRDLTEMLRYIQGNGDPEVMQAVSTTIAAHFCNVRKKLMTKKGPSRV